MGLIENLIRSIPEKLSLHVDLSKIKVGKIFKWLKTKNISDDEMIRTFNCGVGFCVITHPRNTKKIKNFFQINISHTKLDTFPIVMKELTYIKV